MKEIGGFIELEKNHLPMMHSKAIALNSGRSCLAYLIKINQIRKIYIPYFLCDSVVQICQREHVEISYYHIGKDFLPENIQLEKGEWLYLVNYYGQLENDLIYKYVTSYSRVIVDHAHAYYQKPLENVYTLYTCRKFFGVPDGGFLYCDVDESHLLPVDESFERMHFLLGRFERSANEFYNEYVDNNRKFAYESIKHMSKLTDNLLRGIDYNYVKEKRTENFSYLNSNLKNINLLEVKPIEGGYMYPLLIEGGARIRKILQKEKIYIPLLWPHVLESCSMSSLEYKMAVNILPLPIDQRYDLNDMDYLIRRIRKCID